MTGSEDSEHPSLKGQPIRRPDAIPGLQEYDPATIWLYAPHTITFLLIGLAVLTYLSNALEPEGRPTDAELLQEYERRHVKSGIWAAIFVYLGYAVLQGPSSKMVRPHPAVWRLVHGSFLVYMCGLVFLLFQDRHSARAYLKHLDPVLGELLPERSYGLNCHLYEPGVGVNWAAIRDTLFDEFVVAHVLGWFGKALVIRNAFMLWTISVSFELMELSLKHWLPNFNECWWDSWVLDVLLCNALALHLGLLTVSWAGSQQYDWRGLSLQPTLWGKARRAALQFTPYHWDRFEWRIFSSPTRCLQSLLVVVMALVFELNGFFLKALLWIPPSHPINVLRLVLWFFMACPAHKEYYEFLQGDSSDMFNKLGCFAWLAIAVLCLEVLVEVKFGRGEFPQPWPPHVVLAWAAAGSVFAAVLIFWQARISFSRWQRRRGLKAD